MRWTSYLPVVGQLIDLGVFVANKIKARKKAKFTPAEREEAAQVARDKIEQLVKNVQKTRGK